MLKQVTYKNLRSDLLVHDVLLCLGDLKLGQALFSLTLIYTFDSLLTGIINLNYVYIIFKINHMNSEL